MPRDSSTVMNATLEINLKIAGFPLRNHFGNRKLLKWQRVRRKEEIWLYASQATKFPKFPKKSRNFFFFQWRRHDPERTLVLLNDPTPLIPLSCYCSPSPHFHPTQIFFHIDLQGSAVLHATGEFLSLPLQSYHQKPSRLSLSFFFKEGL